MSAEPGLRQRKKAETRVRIHKAAMDLFGRKGFSGTTVAEIAAAADVSVRTVFVHFPSKEDIVFGDAESALDSLDRSLASRPPGVSVTRTLREWLDGAARGWIEPEAELQARVTAQVPGVADRRTLMAERVRKSIADAIAADLGEPPESLAAQVAAGALVSGMNHLEAVVSEELRTSGEIPSRQTLDEIFDRIDRFISSGLVALDD